MVPSQLALLLLLLRRPLPPALVVLLLKCLSGLPCWPHAVKLARQAQHPAGMAPGSECQNSSKPLRTLLGSPAGNCTHDTIDAASYCTKVSRSRKVVAQLKLKPVRWADTM